MLLATVSSVLLLAAAQSWPPASPAPEAEPEAEPETKAESPSGTTPWGTQAPSAPGPEEAATAGSPSALSPWGTPVPADEPAPAPEAVPAPAPTPPSAPVASGAAGAGPTPWGTGEGVPTPVASPTPPSAPVASGAAAAGPTPWGSSPAAQPAAAPASVDGAAPPSTAPWGSGPAQPTVRVVYTGDLGGVGSGHYAWETLRQLQSPALRTAVPVTAARTVRGTLVQGDWLLEAPDGRVETVLGAVAPAPPRCTPAPPVWRFAAETETVVVPAGVSQEVLEALTDTVASPTPFKSWTCSASTGESLRLVGPSGLPLPSWSAADWEFRVGVQLESPAVPGGLLVQGIPQRETSRVFATLDALTQDPSVVYVDTGSFVDGASSVASGQLSRHRPLGFAMLSRLQPDALVPGATELVKGPAAFLTEARAALPDADTRYVATNWSAADPALQLARSRVVSVAAPGGTRTLAFVGIVDPVLADWIPALEGEGVTLLDPVTSVQDEVDALHAAHRLDAVIALTSARGPLLAELRRRLRGVSVLAGDPSFATLRVEQRDVQLRPMGADREAAPLSVSLDGVATLDLSFTRDGLAQVRTTPQVVDGQVEPDPAVRASITRTRAAVYPALDQPLLPAPGAAPLETWSAADWTGLVCEAVRAETGAHTVFLRALPAPPETPGPLSRLEALDHLALLDELVSVQVPGDQLQRVLDQAQRAAPVSCGAQSPWPKPDGRLVDPQRTYTLVTTDRTAHGTALGSVLAGIKRGGPLDPPLQQRLAGPGGGPLTLAQAVLGGVEKAAQTQAAGETVVTELLERRPGAMPSLWLLRMRQLSAQVVRFRGMETEAFSRVPDTLATNPSSVTLTAGWDAAVEHSGPVTLWDARARGAYSTLQTDAQDPPVPLAQAETADDVRWSTSLAVPAWTVPLGERFGFMPYTEALYDTELTPTFNDQGSQNPRQRDLSLTLGVAAPRAGMLRTLRVGAFGNRDLSRLDDKPAEFGAKAEVATWKKLAGSFTWTMNADLQVWANTPDDDRSDLRFRFSGDTRLGMPLTRWLAVSPFVQALAIQGRTPATQEVGLAWTGGAALDLSGAFRLDRP